MKTLLLTCALQLAVAQAPADPAAPAPPAPRPLPALAPAAPTSSALGLLVPLLVLGGLGGALVLARRRRALAAGYVQVLETAPLGPRRSLVVVQLGGETLLLGASEAGIHLLCSRPSEAVQPLPAREPAPSPAHAPAPAAAAPARAAATSFEEALAETAEDQELRRKLALGRRARVAP